MRKNIEELKGSILTGFSFPIPGVFNLKCLLVETLGKGRVRHFDLLFLRAADVEIKNNGPLVDSEIVGVQMDSANIRFDLTNGFVSINCQEMQMRSFDG